MPFLDLDNLVSKISIFVSFFSLPPKFLCPLPNSFLVSLISSKLTKSLVMDIHESSRTTLSEFFDDGNDEFGHCDHDYVAKFGGAGDDDDLFSILESLENVVDFPPPPPPPPLDRDHHQAAFGPISEETSTARLASQKSTSSSTLQDYLETTCDDHDRQLEKAANSSKSKRLKVSSSSGATTATPTCSDGQDQAVNPLLISSDGQGKTSHITVERNRRKQMNEHLSVLRSLMPSFYVKRGDQASIIGGVVSYINELQQVLQSLEAKKQRKIYSEVLSPRLVSSPRPSPPVLSPRKPPLSPRLSLPISPRTPQPGSPYKPGQLQQTATYLSSPTAMASPTSSSTSSSNNIINNNYDNVNELSANSKSAIAHVEVKCSGSNLLLKTVSPRISGQVVKIIAALEDLSLEILHFSISTFDETTLNSFTIKIGVECQLSAEELARQIQQTFSKHYN